MQTKLSICSSSLKMSLQQLVVIVSIATITQQISTTAAFPLAPRLPGDNLPTNEATVSKEDVQADKDVHIVKRSEPIDTETVTAAQLIYRTYENLQPELQEWLFEMDMVRSSRAVEEVLRKNGLLEPEPDRQVEPEPKQEQGSMRHRERKAAGTTSDYLWPNGRIPYVFESSMGQTGREAALKGMNTWMQHTCVRFVPKEKEDENYIQFANRDGCWSYVGMQGGVQLLSLGRGRNSLCEQHGVVLHEIAHAIGLWHEQSRPDRDLYIRIDWPNIEIGARQNFEKYSRLEVETFSIPYDYGSIMHYWSTSFSWNGKPTIIPLKPGVNIMGQRRSLSPSDIKIVNLMYGCEVTNITKEKNASNSSSIPDGAFLMMNSQSRTCLGVANRTTDWSAPILDSHVYTGLYFVALTECAPDNIEQYWQWTPGGSLLNLGFFLCLTALDSEYLNMELVHKDTLVLMHCRTGDPRQQWACATSFIENPHSGKCATALVPEGNNAMDDGEVEDIRHKRNEESRDEVIYQLEDEINHFMTDSQIPIKEIEQKKYKVIFGRLPKMANYSTTASINYCDQTSTSKDWSAVYYQDNCLHVSPTICFNNNTSVSHNLQNCYAKDMTGSTGLTFYYADWIGCNELGYYSSGFYHTNQISGNGATAVLTGIKCCASGSVFTGLSVSPPALHDEVCEDIEWWNWQETLINEGWFSCPRGMFLKSFLITIRPYTLGHFIWKVKCCKPHFSSLVYEHCYKDYGGTVANTGVHLCNLEGYHVTGMYKECGENDNCTEEIMCCMALGV